MMGLAKGNSLQTWQKLVSILDFWVHSARYIGRELGDLGAIYPGFYISHMYGILNL